MGDSPSSDIFYGISSEGGGCDSLIPDDEEGDAMYSYYDWQEEFYRRIEKEFPGDSYRKPYSPAIQKAGVIMGTHGYGGDPGHYIALIDSHLDGDWESKTILDPLHFQKNLPTLVEWNEKLKAFCALMGIEFQKPEWLLLSSYG